MARDKRVAEIAPVPKPSPMPTERPASPVQVASPPPTVTPEHAPIAQAIPKRAERQGGGRRTDAADSAVARACGNAPTRAVRCRSPPPSRRCRRHRPSMRRADGKHRRLRSTIASNDGTGANCHRLRGRRRARRSRHRPGGADTPAAAVAIHRAAERAGRSRDEGADTFCGDVGVTGRHRGKGTNAHGDAVCSAARHSGRDHGFGPNRVAPPSSSAPLETADRTRQRPPVRPQLLLRRLRGRDRSAATPPTYSTSAPAVPPIAPHRRRPQRLRPRRRWRSSPPRRPWRQRRRPESKPAARRCGCVTRCRRPPSPASLGSPS